MLTICLSKVLHSDEDLHLLRLDVSQFGQTCCSLRPCLLLHVMIQVLQPTCLIHNILFLLLLLLFYMGKRKLTSFYTTNGSLLSYVFF